MSSKNIPSSFVTRTTQATQKNLGDCLKDASAIVQKHLAYKQIEELPFEADTALTALVSTKYVAAQEGMKASGVSKTKIKQLEDGLVSTIQDIVQSGKGWTAEDRTANDFTNIRKSVVTPINDLIDLAVKNSRSIA